MMRFSWGRVYILLEALLLFALTWIYAIFLTITEYLLGVVFLVISFISLTAIFSVHYLEYGRDLKVRARATRSRRRAMARLKEGGGPDDVGRGGDIGGKSGEEGPEGGAAARSGGCGRGDRSGKAAAAEAGADGRRG